METLRDIRYEEEYLQLKRSKRKLKRKLDKLSKMNMILTGIVLFLLAVIIFGGSSLFASNRILSAKIDSLNENIKLQDQYNLELTEKFDTLSNQYAKTAKLAVALDEQNQELVNQVNTLNKTLDDYEAREELFDEYEYAIIREDGSRTDITYDNINNLKSVADELGMTDDAVNLILSIAMVESQGTEKLKNAQSSATGIGQILSSTGEYVWTQLMHNSGRYNHSTVASNADNNMSMMAYYIDYLNDKYNGNAKLVMKEYRGLEDQYYFDQVDKYLAKNDLKLSTLKLSSND